MIHLIRAPSSSSSSATNSSATIRPAAPRSLNSTGSSNTSHKKKKRVKLSLKWFLGTIFIMVICLILAGFNILIASHATHKVASFQHRKKRRVRMGVLGKSSKPPLVFMSKYDTTDAGATAKFEKDRQDRSKRLKKALGELSNSERIEAVLCQVWEKDDARKKKSGSSSAVIGHDIQDRCKRIKEIYVKNAIDHNRWYCGKKIPPQKTVKMENCRSQSFLYEREPTLSGSGMPPEVVSAMPDSFQAGGPFVHCPTSPCQLANEGGLLANYFLKDAPWSFTYSMEGSGYYPNLKVDHRAYRRNEFFATTSFQSEIPLPYFSWAEYDIKKPMLDYDQAIKGASFLARNCGSNNNREDWVKGLSSLMRVDSLSTCLHNQEFEKVGLRPSDSKIKVQRKYLFHLAFENTCEEDYITEKLWGTLESGTLPVYFGAPNVKEHAPANSIISVHDFKSAQELADYLTKVANNRTLYESYHAWRNEPELPLAFRNKYNFTHQHSICRICMWAYAKRYGFGWDYISQTVRDTILSRQVCLDDEDISGHGLLLQPVEESFYSPTSLRELNVKQKKEGSTTNNKVCNELKEPRALSFNGWKRTLYQMDGILDVVLQRNAGATDIIYALTIPITRPTASTTATSAFPRVVKEHVHYIYQNDVSRVTILMDPPSQLMYSNTNKNSTTTPQQQQEHPILGIQLLHSKTRIRVIVTDVDTFHKDATQRVGYFEEFASHDFYDPLQKFTTSEDYAATDKWALI